MQNALQFRAAHQKCLHVRDDTEGVLAEELSRLPQIYPFTPTITPYELMRLERFEVLTQGSGAVLVYPAHRQRERVVNNLGW
jgi:hypothetical protein